MTDQLVIEIGSRTELRKALESIQNLTTKIDTTISSADFDEYRDLDRVHDKLMSILDWVEMSKEYLAKVDKVES